MCYAPDGDGMYTRASSQSLFLWGQSVFIIAQLLTAGLLHINELDPIRRYLPSYNRPRKGGRYSAFQVRIAVQSGHCSHRILYLCMICCKKYCHQPNRLKWPSTHTNTPAAMLGGKNRGFRKGVAHDFIYPNKNFSSKNFTRGIWAVTAYINDVLFLYSLFHNPHSITKCVATWRVLLPLRARSPIISDRNHL